MTASNDNDCEPPNGLPVEKRDAKRADALVGRRIKELRQRSSLSVSEVAQAIGLPEHDLDRAEAGQLRLQPNYLLKLADFLDVGVHELFLTK